MTRRQRHARNLSDIPGGHDQTARVGRRADLLDELCDLVDMAAIGRRPRAPLCAVDRAELTLGIGPFVPDGHAVFLQIAHVGAALQEPQEFVHDGLDVHFLGGDERETFLQVEAHLVAEHRARARAGSVGLVCAMFKYMAHEV